jgi:hypothetical protein
LEKLDDDYQKEVERFFDLHAKLLNAINRTGRATRFKFRRVLRMLFNQYKEELYDDVEENEAKYNKIIEDYIKECKDYHDKDIINDAKLAFKDAVVEMMTGQWVVNVILNDLKKFRKNKREDLILLEKFMRNFAEELRDGELQGKMSKERNPEKEKSIIE